MTSKERHEQRYHRRKARREAARAAKLAQADNFDEVFTYDHPSSVTRQRRKLKKLRQLLTNGEMLPDDVYNSFQSWDSHAARFDTYRTRQTMRNLFAQLFPEIVEEKERQQREREWQWEQAWRAEMEQYRMMWDRETPTEEGGNST